MLLRSWNLGSDKRPSFTLMDSWNACAPNKVWKTSFLAFLGTRYGMHREQKLVGYKKSGSTHRSPYWASWWYPSPQLIAERRAICLHLENLLITHMSGDDYLPLVEKGCNLTWMGRGEESPLSLGWNLGRGVCNEVFLDQNTNPFGNSVAIDKVVDFTPGIIAKQMSCWLKRERSLGGCEGVRLWGNTQPSSIYILDTCWVKSMEHWEKFLSIPTEVV